MLNLVYKKLLLGNQGNSTQVLVLERLISNLFSYNYPNKTLGFSPLFYFTKYNFITSERVVVDFFSTMSKAGNP